MIPYTAFAAATLGLLFIVLASFISRLRIKNGISLGDGDNRDLSRAIRAHGNLAEFAPIFLMLVLVLELRGAQGWGFAALVLTFVAARIVHGAALTRRASSLARQVSAGLSYLTVLIAALWLLISLV